MTNAYARLGHIFLGWFLPRNEARCVHVRIVYIHTHLTLRCIVLHWMALHYVTSSKIKLGSSSPYQVWRVWKMKSSWNTQPLILVISSFHGVIVFMFLVKMSEITNQIDHQLSDIPFPLMLVRSASYSQNTSSFGSGCGQQSASPWPRPRAQHPPLPRAPLPPGWRLQAPRSPPRWWP